MAEFYPDGECNHHSEKLDIKRSESLVAQVGNCWCGSCRLTIPDAETALYCPAPDCGVRWKQVIYTEPTVGFRHDSLPMFSKAVLRLTETQARRHRTSLYPNVGRRAVEDVSLIDGIL